MITRDKIKNFRTDFASTVASLEKKYGVKIELGTVSFTDIEFHVKMTCTETSAEGSKKVNTSMFPILKEYLGFAGNIGDKYVSRGITYTIVNLDSKKAKYPVIIAGSDGKSYKTTVESANAMLSLHKVK